MKIYLIRHARTKSNDDVIYAGRNDEPILQEHFERIEQLSLFLSVNEVAKIYSSPLRRAKMTAELVSKSIKVPIIVEDRLNEIEFGPWTGLQRQEIEDRYAQEWWLWRNDPFNFVLEGAETLGSVQERSVSWLESKEVMGDFLDKNRAIAAVTHETNIKSLFCALSGNRKDCYRSLIVANCSVHVLKMHSANSRSFLSKSCDKPGDCTLTR